MATTKNGLAVQIRNADGVQKFFLTGNEASALNRLISAGVFGGPFAKNDDICALESVYRLRVGGIDVEIASIKAVNDRMLSRRGVRYFALSDFSKSLP